MSINYAESYQQALANQFPRVLYFGALWNTPNNRLYKVVPGTGGKVIQIPKLTVGGRIDADRDTIGSFSRNFDNSWETKTLSNQRKWDTLVHPMDIDQTNMVASIANITRVMNETQKFPEMDAYMASSLHSLWTAAGGSADNTVLTSANILVRFDAYMTAMDNARVPAAGRLLYCTPTVKSLLKNATEIQRYINATENNGAVKRAIANLDNVEIISVPEDVMKTTFNFTSGWAPGLSTKQISMILIHPTSMFAPTSYSFAGFDEPSAKTAGKFLYYEESFEDVFVLNERIAGIQMNVSETSYTLSFDANAGTGTMAAITGVEAGAVTLPTSSFTVPNGKTFVKWNTLANGSGTDYIGGATYTFGAASATLYAQWTS